MTTALPSDAGTTVATDGSEDDHPNGSALTSSLLKAGTIATVLPTGMRWSVLSSFTHTGAGASGILTTISSAASLPHDEPKQHIVQRTAAAIILRHTKIFRNLFFIIRLFHAVFPAPPRPVWQACLR